MRMKLFKMNSKYIKNIYLSFKIYSKYIQNTFKIHSKYIKKTYKYLSRIQNTFNIHTNAHLSCLMDDGMMNFWICDASLQ